MPHIPKPFYRAPRRTWFVEVAKKQHPPGKHPDGLPEPRKGHDGSWIAPPEIMTRRWPWRPMPSPTRLPPAPMTPPPSWPP